MLLNGKYLNPRPVKEIFELVVSLGGLISGEHGIGLAKKKYLIFEEVFFRLLVLKADPFLGSFSEREGWGIFFGERSSGVFFYPFFYWGFFVKV